MEPSDDSWSDLDVMKASVLLKVYNSEEVTHATFSKKPSDRFTVKLLEKCYKSIDNFDGFYAIVDKRRKELRT